MLRNIDHLYKNPAFVSEYLISQIIAGCQLVLVIDRNQNNRRAACMASEAGYIEYQSLLGSIKIGCIDSQAYYVLRFCVQIMRS